MKRFGWIFLAALMALTLAACGQSGERSRAYETRDLQALVEGGAFSEELEELDGDVAFSLYRLGDYGLEREELTGCAVLRSAGATCEEGAVLVFDPGTAGDKLDQVEQALKDYLQSQIDSNETYRPNEIPKLEKAILERRENTFLMVVAGDQEKAESVCGGF